MATNVIPFYNACITCKGTEIRLADDTKNELSKAGGIRAVCIACARNTKPQVWNEHNPPVEAGGVG
jgi:hypothetical protein